MAKNTEQSPGQSADKVEVLHLCILLAAALGIGLYLIAHTVVISPDGVTFIEYARNLQYGATKTMLSHDQHPGYPVLLFVAHNAVGFFSGSTTLFSWIYAAQGTALLFRLLSIVVLYFLGKDLVGRRFSFWAVLAIVFLPFPARYGSDALSDWPHFFFLSLGLLLAIRGANSRKLFLFGLAGLAAGLGYLIRPECGQIVIYCLLWLILQLITGRSLSRSKAALALGLSVGCVLIVASPYMMLKSDVVPKKRIEIRDTGEFNARETSQALVKLGGNIGDTLEWIFVPAWFVGLYKSFRKTSLFKPEQFFIIVLVGLNIILMIWLYGKFCYMDKRHTLALVIFTAFYIPAGIGVLSSWLANIRGKQASEKSTRQKVVFYVLFALGVAVCISQLFKPARPKELCVREAAEWISKNTDSRDMIGVSDVRIGFYAERPYAKYDPANDSKAVGYVAIVRPVQSSGSAQETADSRGLLFSQKSKDGKTGVFIYGPRR